MNIHILGSVGYSALRGAIEESVSYAGYSISKLDEAAAVVGMVDDPNWSKVLPEQRIIMIKDPAKVDTVPSDAVLFSVYTLTMIDDPKVTLHSWFRSDQMPRWRRFHARH